MDYSKIYISKSGQKYQLWAQKNTQNEMRYGWNIYQYNNWYNDTGEGFFSAEERDKEFKKLLKE